MCVTDATFKILNSLYYNDYEENLAASFCYPIVLLDP